MPLRLHRINLTQFRGYEAARIDLHIYKDSSVVVLTGENGSGKTNILEAVSLLTPGKGLRGADLSDLRNKAAGHGESWGIAAEVETPGGLMARIGTGPNTSSGREDKRRLVRIDGRDVKSQSALAGIISAVWLTPQMDRLFLEGPSARRKFLDRLVFAYDPGHTTRVGRYDKNLRERLKLLQIERGADPKWLDALESQISQDAVAIAAARLFLVRRLQEHADETGLTASLFPRPLLSVTGSVEAAMMKNPALAVEDSFKEKLLMNREADRAAGRTLDGTHRSDLAVTYGAKDMPAAQCSTGEQKALLVSIVLAHARMMRAEKGFVPLILLDEVAAHLDDRRRAQLFEHLLPLEAQVWLTGTEAAVFYPLKKAARFFDVRPGLVTERALPEAV